MREYKRMKERGTDTGRGGGGLCTVGGFLFLDNVLWWVKADLAKQKKYFSRPLAEDLWSILLIYFFKLIYEPLFEQKVSMYTFSSFGASSVWVWSHICHAEMSLGKIRNPKLWCVIEKVLYIYVMFEFVCECLTGIMLWEAVIKRRKTQYKYSVFNSLSVILVPTSISSELCLRLSSDGNIWLFRNRMLFSVQSSLLCLSTGPRQDSKVGYWNLFTENSCQPLWEQWQWPKTLR